MVLTKRMAKDAMKSRREGKLDEIVIPGLELKRFTMKIVEKTPLIVNAWSQKAMNQILAKHMKITDGADKEAKDPLQQTKDARHMIIDSDELDGGVHGFPIIAIKCAAVSAAADIRNMTVKKCQRAFFIESSHKHKRKDLVELKFNECISRQDMVRLKSGMKVVPDVRFRPEYHGWSMTFDVVHDPKMYSQQQIMTLIQRGGFSVGIGEWRPDKNGLSGRFELGV